MIQRAHDLLKEIDPGMKGLQAPAVGHCGQLYTVTGTEKFIQILHTGNQHWICVSTVGSDNGIVDLYDSLSNNTIEGKVFEQVKNLVGNHNFSLRIVQVQQQGNGSDCGVFSIAFATCLIFGKSPQTVKFNVQEMRRHLYQCLKNNELKLFPTL